MRIIRSGRHPLAVTFLVFLFLGGGSQIVNYQPSAPFAAAFPGVSGQIFYVGLTGASALTLLGVLWPGDPTAALIVERAGAVMVSGPVAGYAVFALPRALFLGMLLLGVALGFVARAWEIGRELKRRKVGVSRLGGRDELAGDRGELRRVPDGDSGIVAGGVANQTEPGGPEHREVNGTASNSGDSHTLTNTVLAMLAPAEERGDRLETMLAAAHAKINTLQTSLARAYDMLGESTEKIANLEQRLTTVTTRLARANIALDDSGLPPEGQQ